MINSKYICTLLFLCFVFPAATNAQIQVADKLNYVKWAPSYQANEDLIPTFNDGYTRFKSLNKTKYPKSDLFSICRGEDQNQQIVIGRLRFLNKTSEKRFVCAAVPNSLSEINFNQVQPSVSEFGVQLHEKGEILLEQFDVLQYEQAPTNELSIVQQVSKYSVAQDLVFLNSLVSASEAGDTVRPICIVNIRGAYEYYTGGRQLITPQKTRFFLSSSRSEIIPAVYEDKPAGWYWNDTSRSATFVGELDSRNYCKYINKGGKIGLSSNYNLLINPGSFTYGNKTQALPDASPKWVSNLGNTWPYTEAGVVNLSLTSFPDIKIKGIVQNPNRTV